MAPPPSPPTSAMSPPPPPPRLLLAGDVLGRLPQLYKRISAVNKAAGPFDAVLCVGQFFPDSSDGLDEFMKYVGGGSPIPIPTYFVGGYGVGAPKVLAAASKDPANAGFKSDGLRVCDNLFWLRGSGKFSLFGVSVAYLSGRPAADGQLTGSYTEDDVDALRALADDPVVVDIFLTNEWPSGILNGANISNIPDGVSDGFGYDPLISQLAAEIKPRYHIAGTKGVFYAREPYSNRGAAYVTRFLGLAMVGNKDKKKFIHAISPIPASSMSPSELRMKPAETSLFPYTLGYPSHDTEAPTHSQVDSSDSQYWRFDVNQKRSRPDDSNKMCFKFTSTGSCHRGDRCSFRHDLAARDHYVGGCCFEFLNKGKCERSECSFRHSLEETGHDSRKRKRYTDGSSFEGNCWFCLSNPNVETHLIVSIGESCYCALAKGQLVEDHALVVPIEHCSSTLFLSLEAETELQRICNALKTYFKDKGETTIIFEGFPSSHANLQVIPIPTTKASDVRGQFMLAAKKLGLEFEVINSGGLSPDGRKLLRKWQSGKSNVFYVELPEGIILSLSVEDKQKLPVQFGREVVASLLNLPNRADWRNCRVSKEDEENMAEIFKKRFEKLDPNNQ